MENENMENENTENENTKRSLREKIRAKLQRKRLFRIIDETINETADLALEGDATAMAKMIATFEDHFFMPKQHLINECIRPAARKIQKNNTTAICATLVGQTAVSVLTGVAFYFLGQETGAMFPVIGGLSLATAAGLIGHQLFCHRKAKRVEKEANFANARYFSTQCARCRDREMDVLSAALSDVADLKIENPEPTFEEFTFLEEANMTRQIKEEMSNIEEYVTAYFES